MRRIRTHTIVLMLLTELCFLPMAVIVMGAFGADPEIGRHLRNYQLPRMLGNTFKLAVGVALFSLILGVSNAWLISIYEFRGRRWAQWLLVLPLAVPSYVMAFAQLGLFDYTGPIQSCLRAWTGQNVQAWFPVRSAVGVSWVMSLALYPYVYLLARVAFRGMGARALEVGQSFGYSVRQSFWRVAVPMARPWLAGGVMLVLMEALADFGAVSIFNYDTLTTGVYQAWFALFSLPNAMQIAVMALILVVILVALERYFRGQRLYARLGVQGAMRRKTLSRRAQVVVWFWLTFVLASALFLPLGQLLVWAIPHLADGLDASFWAYVRGSMGLGAMAALCVCAVALLLALAHRYARQTWAQAWVAFLTMGYAVPGTVLAVGVYVPVAYLDNQLAQLGWGSGAVLKGTLGVMLWAYTVRFLAVGFSSLDGALQRISPAHEQVARSLGEHGFGLIRRVYLPLMRSGIATAGLMVFVDVMKEMPITLMTRPLGWDSLSVRIFALTTEGMWQEAALPALSLVAVGVIPVLLLLRDDRS